MGRSRGTSKEPAAGSSSLAQRLACVRRDEDSVAGSTRRRALFLSLVSSFSWIFTHRAHPPPFTPPRSVSWPSRGSARPGWPLFKVESRSGANKCILQRKTHTGAEALAIR